MKKLLLCLVSAMVLVGCGGKTSSDSSQSSVDSEPPITEYYATVNSKYDVVNVYSTVGETFDLRTIDSSRIIKSPIEYSIDDSSALQLEKNTVKFLKPGIYNISADSNDFGGKFGIKAFVSNEKQDNYPVDIDLNEYVQRNGSSSNVKIENNAVTLTGVGADWNRITYDMIEGYSSSYTLECDVTFLSASDPSRWFGIVFGDQETVNADGTKVGYPYYQFDLRQNSKLTNAIELTYVYSTAYSYPYTGAWTNEGPGVMDQGPIHIQIDINGTQFNGKVSYGEFTSEVNLNLPTTVSGSIGFQCAGSTVKFDNLKVSINSSVKISSTANSKETRINLIDDTPEAQGVDTLKPFMIASGLSIDDFYGVGKNIQQFYVKMKNNTLYSINDEEMSVSLNNIFSELRGEFIPNIQVEDETSLNNAVEICKSFGISDLVIWSSKTEILDKALQLMPYARMGYIPTNITKFETYDEIAPICREAGKHYANLILIDSDILNKENVNKTVGLGYSVVANAKNGTNYSVISSALTGCKLILANYTKDVHDQVDLLYDNTVFNVDNSNKSLFSRPYATGHRGSGDVGNNPDAKAYAENTLESFEFAFSQGALALEIDVHETADHRLAVIHDATTGYYSNVNLTVKNSTLAQLQAIPLKDGNGYYRENYHIPSLEEVFTKFSDEKYKDKTFVVEIKDNTVKTGQMVIEMAKEMGWYNRIVLITFNAATAKTLRDYDPGVQVGYLGTVKRDTNEQFWTSIDSYLSMGVGLSSQFVDISKDSLQESNARGYMYWLWTFSYGNGIQVRDAVNNGNRSFTTNYIGFFSKNKYKLIPEENITLGNGESKKISVQSINYAGALFDEEEAEIIVLSNNAKAEGNTLTRTGSGDIYITFKLKTTWTFDTTSQFGYYIYSDMIVVK